MSSCEETIDFLMAVFCKSKKSFFSPLNQPLPLFMAPPSALASAIHHALTFCCVPLIWLVVALPSASTPIQLQLCLVPWSPPLCSLARDSVRRCLQFTSASHRAPLVRLVVAYPSALASRVATLSFDWLSHIPVPQPLPLVAHHRFRCCRRARPSLARGLICCCHLHTRPLQARGLPRPCPCCARQSPGCGPKELASPSG